MKFKFLLPAFLAAFMAFAPSIQAEETDMAKIPCKEFAASSQNDMTMLVFWIDGYLSGISDNTVLSEEYITELTTHMVNYCTKNGSHTIMQAIEAIN